MKTITFIIPIHKYDDFVKDQLKNVITSIESQVECTTTPEVVVVYSGKIKNLEVPFIESEKIKIKYFKNNKSDDYQSQVNFGVGKITTEYFSVIEFDDEVSTTYVKNFELYTTEYPGYDVLMPILIEVDKDNKPVKLTNEVAWSAQYSTENEKIGYVNDNMIKEYTDFKLSGAIIKKSSFINIGNFKKNIPLTFMLEFILRCLVNGLIVFVIPKIMYKHVIGNEGSLFNEYSKMEPAEKEFWYNTALKEYYFTNDRDVTYTPKE